MNILRASFTSACSAFALATVLLGSGCATAPTGPEAMPRAPFVSRIPPDLGMRPNVAGGLHGGITSRRVSQ